MRRGAECARRSAMSWFRDRLGFRSHFSWPCGSRYVVSFEGPVDVEVTFFPSPEKTLGDQDLWSLGILVGRIRNVTSSILRNRPSCAAAPKRNTS